MLFPITSARKDHSARRNPMTEPADPSQSEPPKQAPKIVLRPATSSELGVAHHLVIEAIDTSPYYNQRFKQAEKNRMHKSYIERLHAIDPAHVMMIMVGSDIAGCMISSPDFGTLWLHWSYLQPQFRRGATALTAMRSFVEYFDNGAFHKIATYTKHGNDAAAAIMKRYGYNHICTLEKQFFGEDYLLYERPLTKVTEGYDNGVTSEGHLGRLKRRFFGALPKKQQLNLPFTKASPKETSLTS